MASNGNTKKNEQVNKLGRTLWVGNIHSKVTIAIIFELFYQIGPINTIELDGHYALVEFKYASSVTDSLKLLPGTTLYGFSIVMKKGSEWQEDSAFYRELNSFNWSQNLSVLTKIQPENLDNDRVPAVDSSPVYDISIVKSNRDEISDFNYRGDYEEISYPYEYRNYSENSVHSQGPEPIINPNLIYCGDFQSQIDDDFKNKYCYNGYDSEQNTYPKNVGSYRFQHAFYPIRQNYTFPSQYTGRDFGRDKKKNRTASYRSMKNNIILR